MRVVEILVEKCLAQLAGIAGKKDDHEKFDEQFGKRLKLENRENSTYRNICGIVAVGRSEVWG